jgi:hypothetical protein
MAVKRPRTLFEAMQGVKEPLVREPASSTAWRRDAGGPRPAGVPEGPAPAWDVQLTRQQMYAALAVVVAVVIGAMYLGYRIGLAQGIRRPDLPTIEEARKEKPRSELLGQGGAEREQRPPAEGETQTTRPSQPPPTPVPGIDSTLSGPFRVAIISLPVSYKASLDDVVRFLAGSGVATVSELRGNTYYLYTEQSFPTTDNEKGQALVKRIRQLGEEYARQTRTRTEFGGLLIKKTFN